MASPSPAPALTGGIAAAGLHPGGVLALQRTAGNHAVASALAGRAGPVLARDDEVSTAETEFKRGLKEKDYDLAARSIEATEKDKRAALLGGAGTEELVRTNQAAERLQLEGAIAALTAKLLEPAHKDAAAKLVRDDALKEARTKKAWPAVVNALHAYDDAGMATAVGTLTLDELDGASKASKDGVNDRVFQVVEPARIAKLMVEWKAAIGKDWERAVTLVQAYNDIDLPIRLTDDLDLDQISALCQQADKMPSFTRVRKAAEPIRIAKLEKAYADAVAGSDWPKAARLANSYNDADLLPRLRTVPAASRAAFDTGAATIFADTNHRVRRGMNFVINEAAVGTGAQVPSTFAGSSVPHTAGTTASTTAVGGGTVTVTTDDKVGATPTADWYGMQYSGADAQKTHWVQFIARETEKFDSSGKSLGFMDSKIRHLGQPEEIKYGTASSPNWYLDTFSSVNPYYEGANPGGSVGAHESTAALTAMYDRPGPAEGNVPPAFDDYIPVIGTKPDKVVTRCRFATYLVRETSVLFKAEMVVEWEYPNKAAAAGPEPARKNRAGAAGAATSIAPAHHAALTRRMPQFTFLPKG